jgi:hypothetical protein
MLKTLAAVAAASVLAVVAPAPLRAGQPAAAPRVYVDEDYDFRLVPPPGWQRGNPARISVPGEVCRVWTPDGTASITAFVQKPGKAMIPGILLDASAQSIEKQGAKILEREVKPIAGMQAMSLLVEGDGTGAALTGKGAVRTRQHWVAIPRESDILVLLLIGPADGWPITSTAFDEMLASLEVGGRQTDEQRRTEAAAPAGPAPETEPAQQSEAAPPTPPGG